MPSWFGSHKNKENPSSQPSQRAPPAWSAAAEQSHRFGLKYEATEDSYESGISFCQEYPLLRPMLVDSVTVDFVNLRKAEVWKINDPQYPGFRGQVYNGLRIVTDPQCQDTCLISNWPIIGGYYSRLGMKGVYYEITVNVMDPDSDGVVSFGMYISLKKIIPYTHFTFF